MAEMSTTDTNNSYSKLELSDSLGEKSFIGSLDNWLVFFLIAGIAARCIRYFLAFPLWEDECFTIVSVYKLSYLDLLKPLNYHQVVPILFLWMGKAVTQLLGFCELSLRLPSFFISIASMLIVWRMSGKLFSGYARLFAVAFFAVSYPNIRYAAEYKPYNTDMFASLLLVWFVMEWMLNSVNRKWLWWMVLWAPIAVGLSFPAIFTASGMSIYLFFVLLKKKAAAKDWLIWLLYSGVFSVAFVVVYFFSIKPQMAAEMGFMSDCWSMAFPGSYNPLIIVKWLVETLCGSILGHPFGGKNFGSTLSALLMAAGLWSLFRNGRKSIAWLLLLPMLMNILTAIIGKYPFGGHVKFSMYFSPMFNMVIGIGAAALLNNHASRASKANTTVIIKTVLVLLGLVAIGTSASDVIHPYKNGADQRQRSFARWFWHDICFSSEAYCMKEDLNMEFSPETWSELSWSAMYLCNQYIYRPKSEDILRSDKFDLLPEANGNIYYVLYRKTTARDFNWDMYNKWLNETSEKYQFVSREIYPMVRNDKHEKFVHTVDQIEILKFREK